MDPKLVIKWLDLFRDDLCDLLMGNQPHWEIFKDLLSHNRLKSYEDEASKVVENADTLAEISKSLWSEISNTPNSPNLFIKVCEFVKEGEKF